MHVDMQLMLSTVHGYKQGGLEFAMTEHGAVLRDVNGFFKIL